MLSNKKLIAMVEMITLIIALMLTCADSPASGSVTAIAGGGHHNIAVKEDGTVWDWGDNYYGELGDGTTTQRTMPVQVSSLTGVTAIGGGETHTIALRGDGTVWTWGNNIYGQLGDGTTTQRTTPVQVSGLTGVTAIAASHGQHTIVLKGDGTVWTWGYNYYGQLGDGTTADRHTPVQVSGLTGVIAIDGGGGYHTVALKSDGTVWTWGLNDHGQLGDGTTTDKHTPVQVSGLTGIIAIGGGGGWHTIALKGDGTVWAWGANESGELGDGTTTDKHTPVQVSGLTGITAIAGGYWHTVALKSDGTVWTWGLNDHGQLGDGTTTDRYTLVQVSGLTGVTAINGGGNDTTALQGDGTVWAWGWNAYGELGDGTTTQRNTPVQVAFTSSQTTYTVTPSAGANGTISPSTPQSVASGATTQFTVTPNTGYTASVGGTCGGTLVGTSYTTAPITANCTVSATFTLSQITYTVTPSAGANGTISPSTPQSVASGGTKQFTVTPNTGYTASVGGTCGGSLVGTTFTTLTITANCTVVASFNPSQTTYTVTPSAGANGTINPSTPQSVASGATTQFTITPNTGYTASVGGTCGGSLVGTTFTTLAITANCTVVASFTAIPTNADKAIIVAGGGPYSDNNLWDSTKATANNAYNTLVAQGFTKDTIKYLSAETGNSNVTDAATSDNLQNILNNWAANANDVIIYFTDHGGAGTFVMGQTDILYAATFRNWLDTLQGKISGIIIFVYDACESGSFMLSLTPPTGKQRIVITSAKPDQSASFVTNGSISFSNYFWNKILNGANVDDAFITAKNAIQIAATAQEPILDDNGDGIFDKKDGSLATTKHIGKGVALAAYVPVVNAVYADPQKLSGSFSAKIIINDADISSTNGVYNVWALIIAPGNTGSPTVPITDLPNVTLNYVAASKRWEGTYTQFTAPGDYKVSVYVTDNNGKISFPVSTTVTQSLTPPPTPPVRDFDGDGHSDVLVQNSSGVVAVWLLNGATIKGGGYVSSALDSTWQIKGVGDFDGDGHSDILLQNSSGALVVWLMNGAAIKGGGYVTTSLESSWQIAGVGDFDGDGHSDILLRNSTTGALVVWLMNGYAVKSGGYVTTSLESSWQIMGVGDFDGDGHSDILLQNSSGAVVVWLMNGSTISGSGYVTTSLDPGWQIMGVGDFDGDGKLDILLRNSTSGALVVWLLNGAMIKGGGYVTTSLDSGWQIKGVGDFDGDGHSDILLQNSSGAVVVWLLNGAAIKSGGYVTTSLDSGWQIK